MRTFREFFFNALLGLSLGPLSACQLITNSFAPQTGEGQKSTEPPAQNNGQAPEVSNESLSIIFNKALHVTLSAQDNDGDALSYTIVRQPAHGVLSGTAPNLIYTPNPNYVGTDSFTYIASDGRLNSAEAEVLLQVDFRETAYLHANGDDSTAVLSDITKPFLTAQAAVDAVQAASPSSSDPVVIDVGAGSFGNVTLNADFGEHVSWEGLGVGVSIIGNINGSGQNGVDSPAPGVNGTDGGDAYDITIDANGVKFGSLHSNGGRSGAYEHWDGSSGTPGASKPGGVVRLLSGTADSIQARGGFQGGNDTFSAYGAARGGTVFVAGTVLLDIRVEGGGSWTSMDYAGPGGEVTVEPSGSTGDIYTLGGSAYFGGHGGDVVIRGTARDVHASGDPGADGFGNNGIGGEVTVEGTTRNIYSKGGTGSDGGNVDILSGAKVVDVDVSGGDEGWNSDAGDSGQITYSLSATIGTLIYNGGAASNFNPGVSHAPISTP